MEKLYIDVGEVGQWLSNSRSDILSLLLEILPMCGVEAESVLQLLVILAREDST